MNERIVIRRSPSDRGSPGLAYEKFLNESQLAVATHLSGPLLVVAGAGSGKTRTLVYRVAYLLERGVPASSILLLTFTRRAAIEMVSRVERLVGGSARNVTGGTFHSFANLALRRYGKALGIPPNFTILDRGDMEDAINMARARLNVNLRERRFPRKGTLADIISMARNKNRSIAQEVELTYPHLADLTEEIVRVAQDYESYKRARAMLDYDDLLFCFAELLASDPEARQALADRYRHLMVDEYQDTNLVQAEIVQLLAGEHRNVMVVGDDGQSIYSFRGANFRNIMEFPRRFPEARVVKLEQNYRSLQGILDLANEILAGASQKYTKVLRAYRTGETRPYLVRAADEHMQSRFVAQRVLELREEGLSLNDIAVLFRSSFHSFDLELELQRRGIPFVKRGGFKFIESSHIKDVLAHLRLLVNPHDSLSWLRALTLLPEIGQRRATHLSESSVASASPEDALLTNAQQLLKGRDAALSHVERLRALLAELRRSTARPSGLVSLIVEYYTPLLRDRHPDDYPRRERDLDQLITIAERYDTLESFLSEVTLEPPTDSVGDALAAEVDDERLVLSTIHSAKGLEWKVVFLIWAAEGRFPSPQSVALARLGDERGIEALEEERRLMYVATTRARDQLYLVYPLEMFDRAAGYTLGRPSRFIEDVAPETLITAFLEEEPA